MAMAMDPCLADSFRPPGGVGHLTKTNTVTRTTVVLPGACRVHCARRLRSLYKTLKFLHGKGRYQKKKLEAAMVTDARWVRGSWLVAGLPLGRCHNPCLVEHACRRAALTDCRIFPPSHQVAADPAALRGACVGIRQ